MATKIPNQSYAEEKLVWRALVGTYLVYLLGALYVTGSILGWALFIIITVRTYVLGKHKTFVVPAIAWVWVIAMFVMLIALWIGHADWYLGTGKTIKSSIGWAKGWALFAVFIVVGAIGQIRVDTIVRGVCILSSHTLIFAAITLALSILRVPGEIYISPLQLVGGPGPNFFTVSLYGMNPETGAARWQFFGPWSPAAGLLACLFFVICNAERDKRIRYIGIAGCFAMVFLSQSRAGLAIFLLLIPMMFFADKVLEPWFLIVTGIVIAGLLTVGQPLFEALQDAHQQVKDARPDSTRVRNTLERLAMQRWQSEAYWFGHGIVERGPKIVEGMPIGTHHSWYGLLFVKGLVGLLALLVPMLVTLVYLFWQAIYYPVARIAFNLLFVLICYSFFENLEILTYLFWPALLIIGVALNPLKVGEEHGLKANA